MKLSSYNVKLSLKYVKVSRYNVIVSCFFFLGWQHYASVVFYLDGKWNRHEIQWKLDCAWVHRCSSRTLKNIPSQTTCILISAHRWQQWLKVSSLLLACDSFAPASRRGSVSASDSAPRFIPLLGGAAISHICCAPCWEGIRHKSLLPCQETSKKWKKKKLLNKLRRGLRCHPERKSRGRALLQAEDANPWQRTGFSTLRPPHSLLPSRAAACWFRFFLSVKL